MNSAERKKRIELLRYWLETHDLASQQIYDMRFLLSELDRRDEVLKRVAKIDIDFIPKGDTFRDVVLQAREALREK